MRLYLLLIAVYFICLNNVFTTCCNPYLFNELGRLSQVEAAMNAANKGGTSIAMKSDKCVVMMTWTSKQGLNNFSKITKLTE